MNNMENQMLYNDGNNDDHIRFCSQCNYEVKLGKSCPNGCDDEVVPQDSEDQLIEIFNDFKNIFSKK